MEALELLPGLTQREQFGVDRRNDNVDLMFLAKREKKGNVRGVFRRRDLETSIRQSAGGRQPGSHVGGEHFQGNPEFPCTAAKAAEQLRAATRGGHQERDPVLHSETNPRRASNRR